MQKFRKRPVVIEAERWFPGSKIDGVVEMDGYGVITTLEGDMIVSPGDWVIIGVEGEKYPCKPGIFDKTYTLVED